MTCFFILLSASHDLVLEEKYPRSPSYVNRLGTGNVRGINRMEKRELVCVFRNLKSELLTLNDTKIEGKE